MEEILPPFGMTFAKPYKTKATTTDKVCKSAMTPDATSGREQL